MLKRVLQPQRFFKMGAAAAAVGLIAVMAIASPANAARYTLSQLDAGASFTVGGVTFYNWSFNENDSTVDPDVVTINTSDPTQPQFRVDCNGEMRGDDQRLVYSFVVSGNVNGAGLWLTGFLETGMEKNGEIDINLRTISFGPGVELAVNIDQARDVEALSDPVSAIAFETRATTALNSNDTIELTNYEIRVLAFDFSPSFDVAYVSQTAGCDGNSPCYTSVQDAVDGVVSFTEIRITSDDYGAVSLSDPKVLILSGGWTSDYSDQSGETTVNSLEINDGSFYDTQFIAMDGLGP